ncbi:MAG: tRNA lysidine(34) synthetase TilS, partial [Casimicrobium sp.]
NRLRNEVWPALTGAFPSAEVTLSRAARWQHESDELANALAAIDLEQCGDNDTLILSRWRALASARRRNLLRRWLAQRGAPMQSAQRIAEWEAQLASDTPTQRVRLEHASFAGSIRRYRDHIYFVEARYATPIDANLRVPWRNTATIAFGDRALRLTQENARQSSPSTNLLRPIKLGETAIFRQRQESDSIRLSPNEIGTSLKNLFQQFGIPPWQRERWPILEIDSVVAAVPGLAVGHAYRANDDEDGVVLCWEP